MDTIQALEWISTFNQLIFNGLVAVYAAAWIKILMSDQLDLKARWLVLVEK